MVTFPAESLIVTDDRFGAASPLLRPGMAFAVEPVLAIGGPGTRLLADGRTVATDTGGWSIDAAELNRVFPLKVSDQADRADPGCESPVLPPVALPSTPGAPPSLPGALIQDRERIIGLETENKALRELVSRLDRTVEDLKAEKDRWAVQTQFWRAVASRGRCWWAACRSRLAFCYTEFSST